MAPPEGCSYEFSVKGPGQHRRIDVSAAEHDTDRLARDVELAASSAARPTEPPGSTTSFNALKAKAIGCQNLLVRDGEHAGEVPAVNREA